MFILVNLKAYDCDPVEIASAAVRVSEQHTDAAIALAPQTADLSATVETGVETWAQHVDSNPHGSHTGSVVAERIAAVGARGTLLNHSERRLRLADIDDGIDRAKAAGLKTMVCANNPGQAAAVAELGPDAVAVEPPELIGSGTPVSQADPDVVRDAVQAVEAVNSDIELHCGAGISTGEDVAAAAELGAEGVLVASGVALADDPAAALASLARAA